MEKEWIWLLFGQLFRFRNWWNEIRNKWRRLEIFSMHYSTRIIGYRIIVTMYGKTGWLEHLSIVVLLFYFERNYNLIVLELLTIRFDIIWLLSVSMLDKWSIFLRMKIFLWMNDPFFEGVFLVITPTIFNSEARNLSNRNLDQFWQLNISNSIVYKFLIPLSF